MDINEKISEVEDIIDKMEVDKEGGSRRSGYYFATATVLTRADEHDAFPEIPGDDDTPQKGGVLGRIARFGLFAAGAYAGVRVGKWVYNKFVAPKPEQGATEREEN